MASPQREADLSAPGAEEASAEMSTLNGEADAPGTEEDGFYEGLQRTDSGRRETFGRAALSVMVWALVFAAGLFLYWRHVNTDEAVRDLGAKAKAQLAKDNPQNLTKAADLLQQAYALKASDPYVLSALGLADAELWVEYGEAGRQADAVKYTDAAAKAKAQKAERYAARGLILVGQGKAAGAEKVLVGVVNEGGMGSPIFGSLGIAQRAEGKIKDARDAFSRALQSEWTDPRYAYWSARTYFDDGDYANAGTFIKKALDANPDHLRTRVLKTRVAIAQGKVTEDARSALKDVLSRPADQLSPRLKALALTARSELLRYQRKPADAVKAADQAIAADGNLADAHLAKGLALADLKQGSAFAEIQKGLDAFPYAPRAYHQAAVTLLDDGQANQALKVMNLWGSKLEKDADYLIAYGNLLVKKGDSDGAMKRYQAAVKLNPDAAEAYYRMGVIDQQAKDYGKAVDMFNKAVQARETYPEVYEAMGWIYMTQGHPNDAVPQFAQALKYYHALNASRRKMNDLRRAVAKSLQHHHKRSWVRPWLKESRDLIR